MQNLLTADAITLRPAAIEDKEKIFRWLAHSNLTKEMLGPPKFPENPIPSWEAFVNDYANYYFDGSQPLLGRCFIIMHHNQEVGQINYNELDEEDQSTEIDIWLADKKYTGKGLGTAALQLLCRYLHQTYNCRKIYIAPSRRNRTAIKSYTKVGFTETNNPPGYFVPDYSDTVVMVKYMEL